MIRLLLPLCLIALQDAGDWIRQLGDESPEVRDEAMAALEKIGKPALPALREACGHANEDIAARARILVDRIDWPDPGEPSNGIALAIKSPDKFEAGEAVLLRGRLRNATDREIVVAGLDVSTVMEGGPWGLVYDGGRELHFCFRGDAARPKLEDRLTLAPGATVEFTFSPGAWCALVEHSKCGPLGVVPGDHTVRLLLRLQAKDTWSGEARSNEARFTVAKR